MLLLKVIYMIKKNTAISVKCVMCVRNFKKSTGEKPLQQCTLGSSQRCTLPAALQFFYTLAFFSLFSFGADVSKKRSIKSNACLWSPRPPNFDSEEEKHPPPFNHPLQTGLICVFM